MSIKAVMRNGAEHVLDPTLGATITEVIETLKGDTLLGSAEPLQGVKIRTKDGDEIAYEDVNGFVQIDQFLP